MRIWGNAQVFHKGDAEWKKGCDLLHVERQLSDFNQTEIPDFLIVIRIVPEMMYIVAMFSDFTRMVTMQNLMHDGGFSSTGISEELIERLTK